MIYVNSEGGDKVAAVSKKWFLVRETHTVEIVHGQGDDVVLPVTVCIDQMAF